MGFIPTFAATIAGTFAAKNQMNKAAAREDALALENAEQAFRDEQTEKMLVAAGAKKKAPDLTDKLIGDAATAEARRLRAKGGRSGSFLTGPGGTIANSSLLTGGMVEARQGGMLADAKARLAGL